MEMIVNLRSFDCSMNSPCCYQRKCVEKSMENLYTDVRVLRFNTTCQMNQQLMVLIFFPLPQAAVGLELWSMTPDILFDNFIITSDKSVADKWASDRYGES